MGGRLGGCLGAWGGSGIWRGLFRRGEERGANETTYRSECDDVLMIEYYILTRSGAMRLRTRSDEN